VRIAKNNIYFTENWWCIAKAEHVIVPFNFHSPLVPDVPDVFESSWIIRHVFLFDAYAEQTFKQKYCDNFKRSSTKR